MEPEKDIKEEMDNLVPGFPKRIFHSPPTGYFDQLPDQLIDRWQDQKGAMHTKSINLRSLISTAAIVAGICFGVVWLTHSSNQALDSTGISSSDAYQYIIDNLDEFEPLIWQQADWIRNERNTPSDSSAIEEYLLEELDGDDIETIF
ncbi:MAG: hypothetical protein KBA14_04035 [Saprospiraceae bacterium]|nr:hypothetical protein [Saprospiraceae bacterium]